MLVVGLTQRAGFMGRNRNTDCQGNPFPKATVDAVWEKAEYAVWMNPAKWRADACGNLIKYSDYGDSYSLVGWEIDHIRPVAKGGTDDLSNLQALQWDNNRRKRDTYPWNGE